MQIRFVIKILMRQIAFQNAKLKVDVQSDADQSVLDEIFLIEIMQSLNPP